MNNTKPKPLILIDGTSYLHRAFHALPPLTNSRGEPTGAIYGVINMIKKLIADYDPEYIAVVFDAKGKNFRHELYKDYKANRPPMANDLRVQVQPLYEIIEAMGLPLVCAPGVEADDVIATLTRHAQKIGLPVLVSTGDKDLAQLVSEEITLINTMTNTIMTVDKVKEKFGIPPEKITDYLALVGDTSDNVRGVAGVGPKTAVKLLQEYGSLENLIKHADEIKGKVGDNLRASIPELPLTHKIVTVKDDVEVKHEIHDLTRKTPNNEKLAEIFKHLEFKNWLSSLIAGQLPKENESNYKAILDEKEFLLWLEKLSHAQQFAFDLETTSLDIIDAKIVGLSFAIDIGEAIYIPIAHDYLGAPKQLARDFVLEKLKPIFEDPHKAKLGQNLKYDMCVLANYGINLAGIGFDTMLESYVLNSSVNQHDKTTLALKYLGKNITSFEDVAGKGAKQLTFNQVALEKAVPYAAADSALVLQLHKVLWQQITGHENLARLYKDIEIPLLSVLARMERGGVCIDAALLAKQSEELAWRLKNLEDEVYKTAGEVFNLNSPQQLQEILFQKLKLPVLQRTPKGQPSTAESILQELALHYQLPQIILEYRSLSKLKSTYTDALPQQINAKTGRVHTSYNQAVTSTGRLSSTNPNLQNIPMRTEEGRKIRRAFIAPPGYQIISGDYSQIELRIMAHLAGDENLQRAFINGADIHRATAAEIFSVALENVTQEQRQRAKAINFGLIYGMSAFGLAKRLGLEREIAQGYIDTYFARYPKVKIYMEKICEKARELGYVETMFGRRIHVPDIKAQNFQLRSAAERAAINAPIQGTAADIIKLSMINIDKWIRQNNIKTKMIMQVHDELVFEAYAPETAPIMQNIKQHMEQVTKLTVPILVEINCGENWGEAH